MTETNDLAKQTIRHKKKSCKMKLTTLLIYLIIVFPETYTVSELIQ